MGPLLIVDVVALLDTSRLGVEATRSLERAWNEAKTQPEEKRQQVLAQLEAKRDGLRQEMLERARPIIQELAKQKKAIAVLEKRSVLWSQGEDVTAAVIAKMDAGPPLKL